MAKALVVEKQLRQVDIPESFQEHLSGRMVGRTLGIASIEACERVILLNQMTTDLEFEEGQDAQSDRQKTDEASGALVALEIHRCQRERFAFEACEVALD